MNVLEHYNSDKLKINDPLNIDDDTYFCKFNYNNMPFIIKTNKICYIKKRIDNSKYINISLTSPDYLLWFEDFYNHCINYVHSKNSEWFEEPLTKTEIEFSFINPLKSNIKDSCFDIQCLIDDNRLHVVDSNDNVTNIDIVENSKIIPSLHIKGIKFNNKHFMFDIELTNLYIILDKVELNEKEISANDVETNAALPDPVDVPILTKNENDLENNIDEINIEATNLEQSTININNKEFYNAYELINNKIKEDIVNNLRNIFINKKIKNNIDLYEMIEDEEDN
jgi:hypothetical protein